MTHGDASWDPAEDRPSMSSFADRALGVFTEPGETFAEIARRPNFISPLVLLVLVSVSVTETMLSKIGMRRIIEISIAESGRASRLSPEQINQAVQRGAAIAGVFAHLSGIFVVPFFLLVVSGVGLIVLNGIFGNHASFKEVFSVACYADLPSVIGGVMAIAVILFGDPAHFNPQTPSPSNPGFFLNPLETSHAVFALVSSFDIFIVWSLILLAMGLSRVTGGKVKSQTLFFIYLGLWGILIMGRVGFALFT